MKLRLATGALAATCSVFLLGACGSGGQSAGSPSSTSKSSASSSSTAGNSSSAPASSSSTAAAAKPAAAEEITIEGFDYKVPTSVKAGAKITITNKDGASHTVTSDTGGLFDAVVKGGGTTTTMTAPMKPGKYPFHCTYHGSMHGVLVVT